MDQQKKNQLKIGAIIGVIIIAIIIYFIIVNKENYYENAAGSWGVPGFRTKRWYFRRPYVNRTNFKNSWNCNQGTDIVSPIDDPSKYYCQRWDPAIGDYYHYLGEKNSNEMWDGKYFDKQHISYLGASEY